jgi:hypothetical protein
MYEFINTKLINVFELRVNIPDIQRIIDDDHVKSLYDFQIEYYASKFKFSNNGVISIAILNNVEYVIDGQHRLKMFTMLSAEFPERVVQINVDYFECKSEQDMEELFKYINNSKPSMIYKMKTDVYKSINIIMKYIGITYKNYIKSSDKPQRPFMNLAAIESRLAEYYKNEHQYIEAATFITKMNELNKYYDTVSREQWIQLIKLKDLSSYDKIGKSDVRCYLGMYQQFEWIDRIFHSNDVSFNQMEHFSTEIYNTTKVTKQLRKNVWDKNNDMNSINLMDSICTICSSHITYDTFECGHIIPRIRGGLTTIDNLERICKQCNRDMGRMNLLIYKQIYAKQTSTSTSTST